MVTSIARQSVIIKCNTQKSILTGNYEFYYAAGLASMLTGMEIPEDIRPGELLTLVTEKLNGLAPGDEREGYLFQLLVGYHPGEEYDEQMKELLLWGRQEERLWTIM